MQCQLAFHFSVHWIMITDTLCLHMRRGREEEWERERGREGGRRRGREEEREGVGRGREEGGREEEREGGGRVREVQWLSVLNLSLCEFSGNISPLTASVPLVFLFSSLTSLLSLFMYLSNSSILPSLAHRFILSPAAIILHEKWLSLRVVVYCTLC